MNAMIDVVAELGLILFLGSTFILALGALGVALVRSPAHIQRLGEITIVATLTWIVIACVPLRRMSLARLGSTGSLEKETQSPGRSALGPDDFHSVGTPLAGHGIQGRTAQSANGIAVEDGIMDSVRPGSPSSVTSASGQVRPAKATPGNRIALGLSEAANERERRSTILAAAYLLGSGVCLLWLVLGRLLVFLAEWRARRAPAWISDMYAQLTKTRTARLFVSPGTRRPFSYGVFRPTIMLPTDFTRRESTRSVLHVLRHEQAHVQRRDAWGHALLNLAFPVLYGNPLYWWLRGRIQFSRELIADDWATVQGSKSSYVEDLLRLLRQRDVSFAGPIGVMGVYKFRNPLARRMKMLLERDHRLPVHVSWRWIGLSLMAAVVLVVGTGAVLGRQANREGHAAGSGETTGDARQDSADSHETSDPTTAASGSGPALEVTADLSSYPAPTHAGNGANWPLLASESQDGNVVVVRFKAIDEVTVPAKVGGLVVVNEAREGLRVKAGQLLARIDDELARLKLETSRVAAKSSETQAKSDVDMRLSKMVEALTKTDLEEARAARAKVENALSAFELRRREYQWKRAGLQIEQAARDFKVALDDHDQRVLELKLAEAELDRHRIVAPQSGVIADVYVSVGEWVSPGDPICNIVRMDRLRAEGFLSGDVVTPGSLNKRAVTVTVPTAEGEPIRLPAHIDFVSPKIEANDGLRFWMEVENPKADDGSYVLRPGMLGRISVGLSARSTTGEPMSSAAAKSESSLSAAEDHYSEAEIAYLRELVDAREKTWSRIKALYDAGAPQGEAENEAASRYQMHLAKARLAHALGKTDECLKHCKAAVEASQMQVMAYQAAYDAGAAPLDSLLRAQKQRAEAKLLLSRIMRGVKKFEVP